MVERSIICINIGSRTKKYSLYKDGFLVKIKDTPIEKKIDLDDFFGYISDPIFAFRIVAPGKFFRTDRKIDDEYIRELENAVNISPLHIGPLLAEIEMVRNSYNGLMYGISDSSFHDTIPNIARVYAIPENIRESFDIEKQGYHGLSIQSAIQKIGLDNLPKKVIYCHMGGGTSVTAIKDGKSMDTSMGWTPLEGIPMAERVGSIDPSIIPFLSEKLSLRGTAIEEFFSRECGLEAVSGISGGDMKDIIKAREGGDERANLAFSFYIYSVRKYIGEMFAILSGCDAILLSGGIAENSHILRQALLDDLSFMGFEIDYFLNKKAYEVENLAYINTSSSKPIIVVKVNENEQIHSSVINLLA